MATAEGTSDGTRSSSTLGIAKPAASAATGVKLRLQEGRLIERATKRGAHRKRRERAALVRMMLYQHGSRHEWVGGQLWDLIVTMDDATGEHYHMQFVEEEGTRSSFQGVEATTLCSRNARTRMPRDRTDEAARDRNCRAHHPRLATAGA